MIQLSKPAQALLDNLLSLYGYKPDYMETQGVFQMRKDAWKDCELAPESAFTELQELAHPEDYQMSDEQHAEYTESRNNQIKGDGL